MVVGPSCVCCLKHTSSWQSGQSGCQGYVLCPPMAIGVHEWEAWQAKDTAWFLAFISLWRSEVPLRVDFSRRNPIWCQLKKCFTIALASSDVSALSYCLFAVSFWDFSFLIFHHGWAHDTWPKTAQPESREDAVTFQNFRWHYKSVDAGILRSLPSLRLDHYGMGGGR